MIKKILIIMVLFVLYRFYKYLTSNYFFQNIEKIANFIYLLLYRGDIYNSIGLMLIFDLLDDDRSILLIKYRERNIVGIDVLIFLYEGDIKTEKYIGEFTNKHKLFMYFDKQIKMIIKRKRLGKVKDVISIRFEQDIKLLVEFILEIKNIYFEIDKDVNSICFMYDNIADDPKAHIGFETPPNYKEIGYDISFPIITWKYYLYRIRQKYKKCEDG
jgi:hypothetical protein